MNCPHTFSEVRESRIHNYMRFPGKAQVTVPTIRRRRVCKTCGYRWTTYELDGEFLEKFCRPPGEDEESAVRQLKVLKHKLASLGS